MMDPDPVAQYRRWEAEAAVDVQAVALATATRDGAPSVRMVLLKQADERGFVFFTNYESRKARELRDNPRAAILVHWAHVEGGRQVRVEGPVERLPDEDSDAYWATRPPRSRAAAYSSRQSEVLASREELERAVDEAERLDPPRPPHWGGFRLEPVTWEFWQHGDDRLHDRFLYRRAGRKWVIERLAP
jgi:pyridoxamine 5'-phosphate oxidase